MKVTAVMPLSLSDGDNADDSANAAKYGVSLEVIRNANGQIDKLLEISK